MDNEHLYAWAWKASGERRPCEQCTNVPSWGLRIVEDGVRLITVALCWEHMAERYPALVLDVVVNG